MIRVDCEGQGALEIGEEPGADAIYVTQLRASFGRELTRPTARDLLRIGQAAFLADRSFRRGSLPGRRTRRLTVTVPVEEPARWRRIGDRVAGLAGFVTHDHWKFRFTKRAAGAAKGTRPPSPPRRSSLCLFSDGLDSLCGAASALRRHETPVLVSHSPPGFATVARTAERLAQRLGRERIEPWVANFEFLARERDAEGRRNRFPERTRRSRPMLYLSMAGAVAIELGISKIFLNENGVLSIHLPVRRDATGIQISRHAHPETLRRFQRLLEAVWPHDEEPTVANRFARMTKADELGALDGAEDLARRTISCQYGRQQVARLTHWFRARRRRRQTVRECGLCHPCLVRRSAMAIAGIREEASHYAFDARAAFRGRERNADAPLYAALAPNVGDLAQFCDRILGLSQKAFVTSYLAQLSRLPESSRGMAKAVREAYRLYRRFARQYLEYLDAGS